MKKIFEYNNMQMAVIILSERFGYLFITFLVDEIQNVLDKYFWPNITCKIDHFL